MKKLISLICLPIIMTSASAFANCPNPSSIKAIQSDENTFEIVILPSAANAGYTVKSYPDMGKGTLKNSNVEFVGAEVWFDTTSLGDQEDRFFRREQGPYYHIKPMTTESIECKYIVPLNNGSNAGISLLSKPNSNNISYDFGQGWYAFDVMRLTPMMLCNNSSVEVCGFSKSQTDGTSNP